MLANKELTIMVSSLLIGAWCSLVARCTGGAEVAGSNPVAPTILLFVLEALSI